MGAGSSWALLEERLTRAASPGIRPGLARLSRLLGLLEHPERVVPAVHVVGTNGKGSTCTFFDAMLRAQGYRTALYTSPHLESPGQRLSLDGTHLSPQEWERGAEELWGVLGRDQRLREDPPTFFELVTALVFCLLRTHAPDVVVLEAGMGGRLDATNMASRVFLSVVTPIAKDHEEFLGSTLEAIASEKFAVLRPGGKAIFAGGNAGLEDMFRERCSRLSVDGRVLSSDWVLREEALSPAGGRFSLTSSSRRLEGLDIALLGPHQLRNAALAVAGMELLERTLPVTEEALRKGLALARWPGRCELFSGTPPVLLDGAHNPHGIAALAETLRRLWGAPTPRTLVFASMKDKDSLDALRQLHAVGSSLICTRVTGNSRSADPENLVRQAQAVGWTKVRAVENPEEALACACREKLPVVVCGSLYLLGILRPLLNGQKRST